TETIIPRIKNDLVDLFSATFQQRLHEVGLQTDERHVTTVIAVSGGYPGEYEKGKTISGLDNEPLDGSIVFHCGTKEEEGNILTNGGRVLAVTSYGNTLKEATEQSNYMLDQLYFEGIYFRNDIGYEFKEGE
ncbi:MAG: phosphoribosylglycinamide synthetase C domain-containing protein, partial [Bacteroidota bacterium]